jgi:hypothetical protein
MTRIEFGLIMLRLLVSNDVMGEARDGVLSVFVEVFPAASSVIRLYVAKIFLMIAVNMGVSMYNSCVPMEMNITPKG